MRMLSSSGKLRGFSRERRTLVFSSLLLAWGCETASRPPPKDYLDQPMGGVIDGKDWTYKHAYIDPTAETAEEDDYAFVFLPFKPKTPCPREVPESPTLRSVTVAAPKATKAMALARGTARVLVFQYVKKGEMWATIAKRGKIKLTKIGKDEVRGKLLGTFNAGNWVSGNFKAVVCDYTDMKHGEDED